MTSKTHRFTTCHRHPSTPVTGFCASCLRERLAGIDSSSAESPELRRTKSFSGRTTDAPSSSAAPEPRRRSCEVRLPPLGGSLSDLFNVDDKKKKPPNRNAEICSSTTGGGIGEKERGDPVRVSGDDDGEGKTMKEFIDLELRSKKNTGRDFRDIAASFREAASVFSKRLMKWRRKQNAKRNRYNDGAGAGAGVGPIEKLGLRTLHEAQSEVGEYGIALGRRSCDTDPRLSVDDSRFSFEAPRASWDGYLIGKAYPRVSRMVRVGDRVLLEEEEEEEGEESLENGEECCPGGSAQTKHYYSNWHRRRRSFDRSNSRRKSLMGEVDELRAISNAKVSPATTELFYGAKVLITENDLRDANLKPINSVQSDNVMGSASKDDACDVAIGDDQKGLNRFHKWGRLWSKLGLMQKRREDRLEEGEYAGGGGGDVVDKPIAESWQKLRRVVNGQVSESVSQKLIRSYSVSCRDSSRTAGLVSGFVGSETKGHVFNGRQKFMLQRNRSVRYSPSNVDNGLLRFYLTPLKSYRRSRSGKSSLKSSNPTARSFF
ncbi:UPF0503 protein, chloroplastic [Glycine soja]|uniref:UPF0503 protein, chloroplastic n=1 Tax=Glycine soja TaxID=3848 RepID=A0A445FQ19_GLYSO|nr:protein OCTOPUS-like [Glycine soja]KAG4923667.1 hypothetical protein JHK87_049207 [Glycine soja]RZB50955.1 UPF0503 protein, chloroplastic [Glycine soja]